VPKHKGTLRNQNRLRCYFKRGGVQAYKSAK
jgi:hypothetical protein